MDQPENNKQPDFEDRWQGLKSQIANMARFAEPPIPIEMIVILIVILWGFNSASLGWLSSTLFTEGRTGTMYYVWLVAGFLLGGVAALISFLNRMYNHMTRVKLTGRDYQHVESGGDKFASGFYSMVTLLVEIVACAMFTYSIVKISDTKVDQTQAYSRLEEVNKVTAYKDSLFAEQGKYYRWLDADGDTTNDRWARKRLDEIERERKTERAIEDSIREALSTIVADTLTQIASVSNGTVLIKDFTKEELPRNSRYKFSLATLAGLLGVIIVGGLMFLAKIAGRYKAFKNIEKVYRDVEQAPQALEDSSPRKFSKFSRWFSSVNGGSDSTTPGSGGDGFDWNSERIKERLDFIKKNYRGYAGNMTMEQIGEHHLFGTGKSYVSQLVKAAIAKKLLLDLKSMADG